MRGIITDINQEKAIILKTDGTFSEIKNRNYQIGQKVKTSNNHYMKYVATAACFMLITCTSVFAYQLYNTPYSYVYVDINPSIRLDINYFDKVISYVPLNDDAKELSIKCGDTKESIDSIIDECTNKGFLNDENNEIEIDVMSEHKALDAQVSAVSDHYQDAPYSITVNKTTKSESKQANDYGISVKKLNAIKEYSSVFGGDTADNVQKLKDNSIKDIKKMITTENVKTQDKAEVKEDTSQKADVSQKADTSEQIDKKNDSTPDNNATKKKALKTQAPQASSSVSEATPQPKVNSEKTKESNDQSNKQIDNNKKDNASDVSQNKKAVIKEEVQEKIKEEKEKSSDEHSKINKKSKEKSNKQDE